MTFEPVDQSDEETHDLTKTYLHTYLPKYISLLGWGWAYDRTFQLLTFNMLESDLPNIELKQFDAQRNCSENYLNIKLIWYLRNEQNFWIGQ